MTPQCGMPASRVAECLNMKQFSNLCNLVDLRRGSNTRFGILKIRYTYGDQIEIQVIFKKDRSIEWVTIKS